MNKLLGIFWLWGVITLSINLHNWLQDPIPSMFCLLLSIWLTVTSLNELDASNIKNELKSIKDISYNDWYQEWYSDWYDARDRDL